MMPGSARLGDWLTSWINVFDIAGCFATYASRFNSIGRVRLQALQFFVPQNAKHLQRRLYSSKFIQRKRRCTRLHRNNLGR